jgi:hypothetical protein
MDGERESDVMALGNVYGELSDLSKYSHLDDFPKYKEFKSTINQTKKTKLADALRKRSAKKRAKSSRQPLSKETIQSPANNLSPPSATAGQHEHQQDFSNNAHHKPAYLTKQNVLSGRKPRSAWRKSHKVDNRLRLIGKQSMSGLGVHKEYRGDINIPKTTHLRSQPFDLSVNENKYCEYKLTPNNSSGFGHSMGRKTFQKQSTEHQSKALAIHNNQNLQSNTTSVKRKRVVNRLGNHHPRQGDPLANRKPRSVLHGDPLVSRGHGALNGLYKYTEYEGINNIPKHREYKSRLKSVKIKEPRLTTLNTCSVGHGRKVYKPRVIVAHLPARARFAPAKSLPQQTEVLLNNVTTCSENKQLVHLKNSSNVAKPPTPTKTISNDIENKEKLQNVALDTKNKEEKEEKFENLGTENNNLDNNRCNEQTNHINEYTEVQVDLVHLHKAELKNTLENKVEQRVSEEYQADISDVIVVEHLELPVNVTTTSRDTNVIHMDELHVEVTEEQSYVPPNTSITVDVTSTENVASEFIVNTSAISQQPTLIVEQQIDSVEAQKPQLVDVQQDKSLVALEPELVTQPPELVVIQQTELVEAQQVETTVLAKQQSKSAASEQTTETKPLINLVVKKQVEPKGVQQDHVLAVQEPELLVHQGQPEECKHSELAVAEQYELPTIQSEIEQLEPVVVQQQHPAMVTSARLDPLILLPPELVVAQHSEPVLTLHQADIVEKHDTLLPTNNPLLSHNTVVAAELSLQETSSQEELQPQISSTVQSEPLEGLLNTKSPNAEQPVDINAELINEGKVVLTQTPRQPLSDEARPASANQQSAAVPRSVRALSLPDTNAAIHHHDIKDCVTPTPSSQPLTPVDSDDYSNHPPQGIHNTTQPHIPWASKSNKPTPKHLVAPGKHADPRRHAKDKSIPKLVFDFSVRTKQNYRYWLILCANIFIKSP